MKAAFKVSQEVSMPGFWWLRSSCACKSSDHDHHIIIEVDRDLELIQVHLSSTLEACTCGAHNDSFWDRWCHRLKSVWKLLTTGDIEVEGYFLFENEDHVRDYIQAINDNLIAAKIELEQLKHPITVDAPKP